MSARSSAAFRRERQRSHSEARQRSCLDSTGADYLKVGLTAIKVVAYFLHPLSDIAGIAEPEIDFGPFGQCHLCRQRQAEEAGDDLGMPIR
jgi:hypothetical protein